MEIELQTAWITGPTSGIGKALARQLAQLGYHLVLVSRREDILAEICQELSEAFDIETQYIAADLSKLGEPEKVYKSVEARGVDIDQVLQMGFAAAKVSMRSMRLESLENG